MYIPTSFEQKIAGAFGEEGRDWLKTLESRVQTCANKWELKLNGPVHNLSYHYVIKAVDAKGIPVILKMGVPNFDFQNEIMTLEAYNGEGCARLINSDPITGAMVLEQMIPGTMLSDEADENQAIIHYAKVWKAIRRPLPVNSHYPSILDWAAGLKRYQNQFPNDQGPIPSEMVHIAQGCFDFLTKTSEGNELLHGDLHHENILYSKNHGWIAIDPKGVAGDRYFDLISFLINQLHHQPNPKEVLKQRIESLVDLLELERERLLKAGIAMSILSACWGLEDQSEWEDTYQCALWFYEFHKGCKFHN
ncbi:aminoglycoside phosphotransferase family protein [Neobacillus sp. Marseille-QA0830]